MPAYFFGNLIHFVYAGSAYQPDVLVISQVEVGVDAITAKEKENKMTIHKKALLKMYKFIFCLK